MMDRVRTLFALGPANVARVAAYRLGLRLKLHPVLRLHQPPPQGPFFAIKSFASSGLVATRLWTDTAVFFSSHHFPLAGIPDWYSNPFRPGTRADSSKPWSEIPDFDPAVGDIKAVWETSRFDWVVAMAQRASLGDEQEGARLNLWLENWVDKNRPYIGANWKCGQEASIRVMHTLLAALLLGEAATPLPGLRSLIRVHLERIVPSMNYAIGQQNNHGTSEAAALFIGGTFLQTAGDAKGEEWAHRGRKWLEERAATLIEPDGTFSQYSVTYHRLMLDTYSLVEIWRQALHLAPFSDQLSRRLKAATLWLQQMVDVETGDAPNIGANDGAYLLPLTDAAYRDFRPSLQLAASLFCGARAIAAPGLWDQPAAWLRTASTQAVLPRPTSISFDCGGMHVLRQSRACAYLRYPRFRFRPSHADALHLDLWIEGENIFRDAGTYSYNADAETLFDFTGTAAHNTIEFDHRNQMPRIGRFLYGSWLRAENVQIVTLTGNEVRAAAGYHDAYQAAHHRAVCLRENEMICVDRVAGNAERAILRWRLKPGNWQRKGFELTNGPVGVSVTSENGIVRMQIVQGFESREYLKKTPLPVLEVECDVPATLTTRVKF